jgi:CheY-like chemotaxis protein
MTGIDAAKEIVQTASPFFIFLTANGYEEYLKGTGIHYMYLKKPFTEMQLIELLQNIHLEYPKT